MIPLRPLLSLLVAASVILSAPVARAQADAGLLRAAASGDIGAIDALVLRGTPIDARDPHGRTALIAAAQHGQKQAVLALLARGAALEAADENGYTPLIWAAQQGHTAVVLALLARGAWPDAREKHDYSALEWAAWGGHLNAARLLLAYGADPARRTRQGFTAIDLAGRHADPALRELLREQAEARLAHAAQAAQAAAASKPAPSAAAPAQPAAQTQALVPAMPPKAPAARPPLPVALSAAKPAPAVKPPPAARPATLVVATAPTAPPSATAAPGPEATPFIRGELREVGRSRDGQPIQLASIGQGDRAVLFIGSIHGDEAQGTDVIHRLLREIPAMPGLLNRTRVLAIPNANPDGVSRRIRTNQGGVDLNRNFPTRWRPTARGRFFSGPHPLSEPESQALQRVIEIERPSAIVAFHAHMACNNFDGRAAEPLARAMARANGYRLMPQIGYETPGSLGQHAAFGMGIPIVTLEVGFEAPDQLWKKVRDSLLLAIGA